MKSFRLFQSTHPTRGCDRAAQRSFASGFRFQSTHPTRGCDGYGKSGIHRLDISIHAPHEGVRRLGYAKDYVRQIHFNPRTPRGGATITRMIVDNLLSISIHAPHEGVRQFVNPVQVVKAISIHAPHEGVRRNRFQFFDSVAQFQSTHPTRGCDSSSSSSISSTS